MVQEFEFKRVGAGLSNWGRWGDEDQIGTLNFITPDTRKAAAPLIRSGRVFDLGMPFGAEGPQAGAGRFNPIHLMTVLPNEPIFPDGFLVADDVVIMPLQCATQWDSLAHVGYDGYLYNGTPASAVSSRGASRNSFDLAVSHLIGRGVLIDLPGLRGVDRLSAGEEITGQDLDAAASAQNVDIRSGDIVLFRTGWYQHFVEKDYETYLAPHCPGLGMSAAEWLHDHEIAAVCGDNSAVECRPSKEPGTTLPLHMVLIRDMGLTLGEMFNLEALAVDCRQEGTWDFFFSGIGLKVSGAVGSPVTPVALR